MDKILSIISLFSAVWSNLLLLTLYRQGYFREGVGFVLVYIIILLFNIFSLRYCKKVQKEKQSSKIPTTIATMGTIFYIFILVISLLLGWWVYITGGV